MDSTAVVETWEGIESSVAVLAGFVRAAAGGDGQAPGDGHAPGDLAVVDPAAGDPLRDQADACLDGMAELGRLEARLAALKVRLVAGYSTLDEALAVPSSSRQEGSAREMSVTAEVAGALSVSERSAGALLCEAHTLTAERPMTLTALGVGRISLQHARVMCDETANLEPAAAAALEAHFLDPHAPSPARGCPAGEQAPGRFRARARAWRERHHPVSIEARHRKCAKDRRLEYAPDRDGMAWLSAYLPADQAAGIWDRTTAAARILQGPAETRTLTQLRADVAAGWLLAPAQGIDGPATGCLPADSARAGDVPSPRAQVLVTVPVFSLLGQTEEPAVLDGYGPIPPSMARRLVADGGTSFLRVLTDPRDGAPLEIGRTSYRLTKPMRHWLRLRDAHCTFPNCNNHSLDNDADHILAWANGGTTGITNLGQPCPKHHRLKHTSAWRPVGATRESPPGWISPAGRSYPAEQQDWEPPHWPDSLKPDKPGPVSPAPCSFESDRPERDGPERDGPEPDCVEPDCVEPDSLENLGPPLPVGPLPGWAPITAA
ncbi:HNH endonuclease signature motif containing protein [Arthrobacter globiformis]|nr:HNH endonuclease signature motif containing protein [Arthrobacter globiformis]